jgi:hypothetical protein
VKCFNEALVYRKFVMERCHFSFCVVCQRLTDAHYTMGFF